MTGRRVGQHVSGGPEPDEERQRRERRDALREAWSRWATGVTILATRAQDGVHALTVGSFFPLSLDPPLVLASLGPNASVLPYLDVGKEVAISILAADQKGLASRYADTFPVGPDPFPDAGSPVVPGALATMTCRVEELLERGDHTLMIGGVVQAEVGEGGPALAYYRRAFRTIE